MKKIKAGKWRACNDRDVRSGVPVVAALPVLSVDNVVAVLGHLLGVLGVLHDHVDRRGERAARDASVDLGVGEVRAADPLVPEAERLAVHEERANVARHRVEPAAVHNLRCKKKKS